MATQQHLVIELELEQADRFQDEQLLIHRANISPTLSCSRVPLAPPPQWGINDLDLYSHFPRTSSSQDLPQLQVAVAQQQASVASDNSREHQASWEGWWSPAGCDSQTSFRAVSPGETPSRPNSFASLLDDDVFTNPPGSPAPVCTRERSDMPAMKLHVWASGFPSASTATASGVNAAMLFRGEVSALSPTMTDKKILVTDSDLRLLPTTSSSSGNMRALSVQDSADEAQNACLVGRSAHFKRDKLFPPNSKATPSTAVKHLAASSPPPSPSKSEHCPVSLGSKTSMAIKTESSLNQARSPASSMYDAAERPFHSELPRLFEPMDSSKQTGYDFPDCFAAMRGVDAQRQQQASNPTPSHHRIGIYPPAERRERLRRFHEKRKLRVYHKRIKYACRKRLANACPRIKGRFVRKTDMMEATKRGTVVEVTSIGPAGQ